MHWFDPLLRFLLSPLGVGILAALDSTLVFWLPLGIDLAMVILGARHPSLFWLYPLIAAGGSVAGAATSYAVGKAAGEAGLSHFVPDRKLARIKQRVARSGALTLAALDLIPPPFPFTLFLVVAGALEVNRTRFFITLGVVRFLRFFAESGLGALYGAKVGAQIGSTLLRDIAGLCVVGAAAASVVGLVRLMRNRRLSAAARHR